MWTGGHRCAGRLATAARRRGSGTRGTRSLASGIPWPPARGKDTCDLRRTNAGSLMSTGSSASTAQAGGGRPRTAAPGATLRTTPGISGPRGRIPAHEVVQTRQIWASEVRIWRVRTTSAEKVRPRRRAGDLGGRRATSAEDGRLRQRRYDLGGQPGPSGAPGWLELAPRSRSCGLSPLGRRGRRRRRGGRGPRPRVCGPRRPRVRR